MTAETLPRWDLRSVFPSPVSGEYLESLATLKIQLDQIRSTFDEFGIGLESGTHPHADSDTIIAAWNETADLADLLNNYLYCWTSTDTSDAAAASAYGEFQMIDSANRALRTRLASWLGNLPANGGELDPVTADHRYQIKRAAIEAQHVMSAELESLAAELQATGGEAWVRARNDADAAMLATVTLDGETKTVSVTELDSLLTSPDRSKRQAAADAIEHARSAAAPAYAQYLNAIKGEAITLASRRNWDSALEWSLFDCAIDREILDAMFAASESVHGDLQRYLQAKAALLGIEALAHYDIEAPISDRLKELSWDDCVQLTRAVLSPFSERLARVVETSLTNSWIDVEPREGKIGGGYCASVHPHGSRILLNFVPAFPTVQTLAHELGHAHHNDCLAIRTHLQAEIPLTLAETASMFCQRLVEEQVLKDASPAEQIAALDQILSSACGLVLDLHARFHFEREVFARRANRTLSADEFTAIMEETQLIAFGPGLDPNAMHKLQWVQKPHYYDAGFHYYNYPYQFGLLFALGLLRVYRDQPAGFADKYENLLSRTGMATAADLANGFGIDIRDRAFWDGSVAVIRSDVERFLALSADQRKM